MEIVLASESPRRRELLSLMGLRFTVDPSHAEEDPPRHETVAENVMALAEQKALAVLPRHPGACVIGADTVVDLDGLVLGKSHTPENAKSYLMRMRGRTHTVYTGIAVVTPKGVRKAYETTRVTFAPLSEKEIDWYISTGEPLDKAGAYGIQGPACAFVSRIEGDYFNVIGMPVRLLYTLLREEGVLTEDRLCPS